MHALVLVTAGLVAGSGPPDSSGAVAYQPAFRGVWVGTWLSGGEDKPAQFDGRKLEVTNAGGVAVTPCTLESDGPGRVRLVVGNGGRREVYLGICRPQGAGVLLCICFRAGERPSRFAADAETALVTLRPAPGSKRP